MMSVLWVTEVAITCATTHTDLTTAPVTMATPWISTPKHAQVRYSPCILPGYFLDTNSKTCMGKILIHTHHGYFLGLDTNSKTCMGNI